VLTHALRRLLLLVPVLFLMSLGTFFLLDLVPGDPAQQVLGDASTPEDYRFVREQLGLDKPLLTRYGDWVTDAIRGDLGTNLLPPREPVATKIARALPVNLELAFLAVGMAIVIAVPVAVLSAYRVGSRFDRAASLASFGLISVPSFLMGLLLVLLFAIHWELFPLGQWVRPTEGGWGENLRSAFLPALTLALSEVAIFTRLLRTDMIATLQADYILAARAKGMPTWHILLREALRPSSFSFITFAGASLARLIGGTVIVESVFALPGMGRIVIDAAQRNDYTLVQGGVLVLGVIYLVLNFGIDVLYGVLDPRIRRGRT
jgi:peptide/nickel transport system permease protein